MSNDIVVSVENVTKAYRIWSEPGARLKSPLISTCGRLFPPHSGFRQRCEDKATAYYRDFYALKGISFQVGRGESVGIIGRNGSGKSTLLQIIAGTLRPTTGSVRTSGRIAALLELGSGFNPEFTGRENVFLGGAIHGLSRAEMEDRFDAIAAFADIGDFIEQPVKTYSSGMQVRLAFAVATAVKPDVLIVDEALTVGDAFFQAKCHERIALFKKEGMSLLLVTHATDDLVRQCDRAIYIRNGHLEKDGMPRDITNLYLDDLFGRQHGSTQQRTPHIPEFSITDNDQDVFHTRPGYRKEEHRWGHGGAAIIDYLIIADGQKFPSQIESNSRVDLFIKARFLHPFRNIIPGILIKTLEGIALYGSNSFISTHGQVEISAETGDIILFRFSMPAALNAGHYLFSFGISTGDPAGQLTPLDRRYDSVLITISRKMQFWGIIDMKADFELVARRAK